MSSTFKYDHNRLFDNLESALKNDLASVAVEANGGKSILFVYPPMEDDEYIEEGKDLQGKGFDPRKLLAPGFEAIKATVKEKMELFGSVGKA